MKLYGIALAALVALPVPTFGGGFGTPVMDGLADGVYGAAEASDPAGDHWANNTNIDMLNLYVCNDNTFWYFLFTVNANVSTTNWGKYRLYIDTTNDANGGTTDAWGRNVVVSDPHKPEFSVGSWVNAAPYGPEDTQWWAWNQGTLTWVQSGTVDGAALNAGTFSGIEWKIEKSRLGDPDSLWCEVWSTGGGDGDNAQDTSNDPADDWNAADWSTQSILANSTKVLKASGGDTTPPTLDNAAIVESVTDELIVTFSEPVDTVTAETAGNYTVTGVSVIGAALVSATSVKLTLSAEMGLGTCLTVTATNVEDIAGNPIAGNNSFEFFLTELFVRAGMSIYLRTYSAAPNADTVGMEGSISPLTWDPTCDDLLADPDGDSTYEGTFRFLHTCSAGVTDTVTLEYKFTHQCVTWEGIDNHVYSLDGTTAIDTLDIWWSNEAPVDFTDKDIDVIFFVRNHPDNGAGWNASLDTIGLNGSRLPLTWDVPPTNRLKDDGALPDSTAGDGVYSARITFPLGSLKNVDFKYLWKSFPDTVFNYECFNQGNRNVFLNDTLFSTTTPIVMDVAIWDICGDPTGVEGGSLPSTAALRLFPNVPNPFNPSTGIEFVLPEEAAVVLAVFDVAGRHVRTLREAKMPAGSYTGSRAIRWDGTDSSGRAVTSGVYFYRLEADGKALTKKMILLR
ncbi:MAG: FlgD immunoglobulin-like domain containing protein [Candidatus Eisenbacteria bacterium]